MIYRYFLFHQNLIRIGFLLAVTELAKALFGAAPHRLLPAKSFLLLLGVTQSTKACEESVCVCLHLRANRIWIDFMRMDIGERIREANGLGMGRGTGGNKADKRKLIFAFSNGKLRSSLHCHRKDHVTADKWP